MKIAVTQTPQDVYSLASITPGVKIQIQNRTESAIRIYAGASAPASLEDYFELEGRDWYEFIGTVCMVYSGQTTFLIVQES